MGTETKKISLYIHVPFCKAKCYYCDFNSFAGMSGRIAPYFKALLGEIELYGERLKGYGIKTIFIGGGTPSFVDAEYISAVAESCRKHFNLLEDAEITIEANPGTLSFEKLAAYRSMGINRLSMGLQACQDDILKSIGRIHKYQEFVENFQQARRAGFSNINVDLIFGLPNQTLEDWKETLEKVAGLEPEHISCYSLSIEEDTVFGDRLKAGELKPADDELDRSMYHMAKDMLTSYGYGHYEISNFAKAGFECLHNLTYWKAEEYAGLGAGAHSYLDSVRFNNVYSVENYIDCITRGTLPVEDEHPLDAEEKMSEFMMLGFRLIGGISLTEFMQRFGSDVYALFGNKIKMLENKGLIEVIGDCIKLTDSGLDLANQVFMEFI